MVNSQWWSRRTGLERFDLATRWPLYLLSASEPVVAILLVRGQDQVRTWGAAVLLSVTIAHTVACVMLLRTGIAHVLGAPQPSPRLVGLTVALTTAGIAAGAAAFPAYGRGIQGDLQLGYPVGVAVGTLFLGALTVAATPLLRPGQLLGVVALPAALGGILQAATDSRDGQPLWALNYLVWVGAAVFLYQASVWTLGIIWELDRSRDVQARLAVAEERLRFARDLHDVLGRNLALIALNSELAARLVAAARTGRSSTCSRYAR